MENIEEKDDNGSINVDEDIVFNHEESSHQVDNPNLSSDSKSFSKDADENFCIEKVFCYETKKVNHNFSFFTFQSSFCFDSFSTLWAVVRVNASIAS